MYLPLISFIISCIFLSAISILVYGDESPTGDSAYQLIKENKLPVVRDANYIVEEFVTGLKWPTTMTFVGEDVLVLEKNTGNVRLVKNGELVKEPVMHFNVDFLAERGLLGIISSDSTVYLYMTEINSTSKTTLGNHIYKAEWDGNNLNNLTLIKKLPFGERGVHNGGVFAHGSDGKIYAVIGDADHQGILQNYHKGEPDNTSIIFDVNSAEPYYAIGIRNSFGIAVDPITGEIWDTENNNKVFDEINLVLYKFNSGWDPIVGPGNPQEIKNLPQYKDYKFSNPEFSWELTVAPTAISFPPEFSFIDYQNSVFVGDFLNGFLYEFKLNSDRTGFVFQSPHLKDLVADGGDSLNEIIFGAGFGGITDIEFGPDGMMYVVSIIDGKIYRIYPTTNNEITKEKADCNSEPKPRIDWSGCDLSKRDFTDVDLAFADLSFANIQDSIFVGTRLTSANMSGAYLENSNFKNANLVNVDMKNTYINNSNFQKAQLRYVNFMNSTILESDFSDSVIRGSNLENTIVKNSNFTSGTLYHSNLKYTTISNSDLTKVDLRYTKMDNAYFNGNILEGANLAYSRMVSMNITNTDMRKTILTYVNFSNTIISNSNLQGTYPYSADFTNTKIMKNTETDSCMNQDLMSRAFNKILRELRTHDLFILKPLEYIFVQLCKP